MLSKHGLKWGPLGQGNTETRLVWVQASFYRIADRKKSQVAMVQDKAGLGGCEVGLSGWLMPPRGDRIREFECLIRESKAGKVKGRDNYKQTQLGARQYLIWVSPRYGHLDEKGTGTVWGTSGIWMPWTINKIVWVAHIIQATWTINGHNLESIQGWVLIFATATVYPGFFKLYNSAFGQDDWRTRWLWHAEGGVLCWKSWF